MNTTDTPALTDDPQLTTGEIARMLGVSRHCVRRCIDRIAPNAPRAGRYRLLRRSKIADLILELHRTEYRVEPLGASNG